MGDLGFKVREIFNKLERKEKGFFGGPPYSTEINRELSNSSLYKFEAIKGRRRMCLGECVFDCNGNVIGYQASTIMNNANPTNYETKYLGLSAPLNYVQLKKILVDPDFWGKGISDELLEMSLKLARENKKDWITDVNSQNYRMIHFLMKHGIIKIFEWKTKSKNLMHRFKKT